MTERIGTVLAQRYHLERLLARGGMGVLYLGRHTLTGRRVAIKVMRSTDEPGTALADRFLREARLAAGIEHPNVVQIFDMGVDQECLFLVMELLEGESLATFVERQRVLPADLALQWLLPVMGALATAHDMRVVHRDVKPDNIFLARRGHTLVPTLLDFGIAKQAGGGTLTESGIAIGTPAYMSPEQARGEIHVGTQTDVWAMGVLLYRCLSGELPFTAPSPTGVLVKIVSERAPMLAERAPGVDPQLARCVDRALNRDPQRRYQDMREFASTLAQVATAQGISLPPDPDPVGLPEWHTWISSDAPAMLSTAATGFRPAASDAEPEHDASGVAQSGQRTSTPAAAPRSTRRLLLRVAVLAAVMGAVAGALWWRDAASRPPSDGVAETAPPQVIPVAPTTPVPDRGERGEEPPAEDGQDVEGERETRAGADAATLPVRAAEPEPPRKRPRPRKRRPTPRSERTAGKAPKRAAQEGEAKAPTPPTPTAVEAQNEADDPFQIRRAYRAPSQPAE